MILLLSVSSFPLFNPLHCPKALLPMAFTPFPLAFCISYGVAEVSGRGVWEFGVCVFHFCITLKEAEDTQSSNGMGYHTSRRRV